MKSPSLRRQAVALQRVATCDMPDQPRDEHAEALLAHYIDLASIPGWKRYAWERVNRMATEQPAMWGHFPERMKAHFATNQPKE